MLELELTPEFDPLRKTVAKEKDKTMKIRSAGFATVLVEVRFHVPGDWQPGFGVTRLLIIAGHRECLKRSLIWGSASGRKWSGRLPRLGDRGGLKRCRTIAT